MNQEALKRLVVHGLASMKAGCKIANEAANDTENAVSNPELKSAFHTGTKGPQQWQQRIDQAQQEITGGESTEYDNPILKAHYEVSEGIREDAADDTSRDLGIIASVQLAMHYWIASFVTMHAYLSALGINSRSREHEKVYRRGQASR